VDLLRHHEKYRAFDQDRRQEIGDRIHQNTEINARITKEEINDHNTNHFQV
jgi:hypothetical protein